MRLSFRLDEDEAAVWLKLKQENWGRTDKYIFHEMLRREDFRMRGNSKDDRLNEIKALLVDVQSQIKEQDARLLLQQLLDKLSGEHR